MTSIAKPTPDFHGRIRYYDAIRFLESKYEFSSYNFNRPETHYEKWCAARGTPFSSIQQHEQESIFAEYCKAPDGEKACPARENFWHWLVDLISKPGPRGRGTQLPTFFNINVPEILTTYDSEIAPVRDAQNAAVAAMVTRMKGLIPADMLDTAEKYCEPKSVKLQPFVRTILGYIEAEFGPVVKFDLRGN